MDAQLLNTLFTTIRQGQLNSYMHSSAFTLLLYDAILVFPRELQHIWRARWTLAKVLYLLARYWALIDVGFMLVNYSKVQDSLELCAHIIRVYKFTQTLTGTYRCKTYLWISVTLTSPALLSIIVNVILVLRLHALYDRNLKILAVLSSLIVADIGGNIFIMYRIGVLTSRSAFVIPPILGLPILGCLAAPDSRMLTFISWVPCVFLNTLFFIMTMVKFYQSTIVKQRRGVRLSPLVVAFFTSGTMSFFIIASMAIVSAAITILVDGPLQILYMPWIVVTFSLAGSRLILNLREAGASNQPIAAMPTSSSLTVVERFSRLDA